MEDHFQVEVHPLEQLHHLPSSGLCLSLFFSGRRSLKNFQLHGQNPFLLVHQAAIATRLEAICQGRLQGWRLSLLGWRPSLLALLGWRPSLLLGWSPSLLGWRPSLLGWRPPLVGWRPSLLGWRPSLLGLRPFFPFPEGLQGSPPFCCHGSPASGGSGTAAASAAASAAVGADSEGAAASPWAPTAMALPKGAGSMCNPPKQPLKLRYQCGLWRAPISSKQMSVQPQKNKGATRCGYATQNTKKQTASKCLFAAVRTSMLW